MKIKKIITFFIFFINIAIGADSDDIGMMIDDASRSFNERGFSKQSNSIGQGFTSINNSNGNLQYSQRLYESDGKNGFNLKLDLNYFGSMQHMSIVRVNQYLPVKLLQFSKPEWILSVNGIPVQVFNFEDRYYTSFVEGTTKDESEVCHFVKGWQYVNSTKSNFNHYYLLRGDGGMFNFDESFYYDPDNQFYAVGPGQRSKLVVVSEGAPRGERVFELYRGDGTIVKYQEYMTGLEPDWPTGMYPVEIRDQYGNNISFNYDSDNPVRLSVISTSWGFNISFIHYEGSMKFSNNCNEVNYYLNYRNDPYSNCPIKMIENIHLYNGIPGGGESTIVYTTSINYTSNGNFREIQDFCWEGTWYGYMTIQYDYVGIESISYPAGCREEFQYVEFGDGYDPVIDYKSGDPWTSSGPCYYSELYKIHGTDPFYNKMVKEKKTYLNDDLVQIKEYSYDSDSPGSAAYDITYTTIGTKDGNEYLRERKKYKYEPEFWDTDEYPDNGSSQHILLKRETIKDNQTGSLVTIAINDYDYYTYNQAKFRMKEKKHTEYENDYKYTYQYTMNTDDINVDQKITIDPLGVRTVIDYCTDFLAGPNVNDMPYLNNLISQVTVDNGNGSEAVSVSKKEYYGSGETDGLSGQLKFEISYSELANYYYGDDVINGNSVTTEYKYCIPPAECNCLMPLV